MQGGRWTACTTLCLARNSSERSGSGKQENDAEERAGGKRSSKDRQRKPEQHETEGPRRPRRGQQAGLNRVMVKDGVTEIAAERVQRGLTESTACESGHGVGAAELVPDVARRGLSTGQQDASKMRESKERERGQIGQQATSASKGAHRWSAAASSRWGQQDLREPNAADASGWSGAWLVALGGVSTPFAWGGARGAPGARGHTLAAGCRWP